MSEFTLAQSSEIIEGKIFSAQVNGASVVATRVDGKPVALSGKCPHLGLPLSKGKIENGEIICAFHGAAFDLKTGKNEKWVNNAMGVPMPKWSHKLIAFGKKPCDLKKFPITERDGTVYIMLT